MRVEGKLLIERLTELAASRNELSGEELDKLKGLFLLVTSSSAETVGEIDNLSYGSFSRPHDDGEYSGLMIRNSGMPLSDALAELFFLDVDDTDVALDRETFRTVVRVVWAIVWSLEWGSSHPHYSNEKAEGLIQAL